MRINADAVQGILRQEVIEPDQEELKAFLLVFRHFISKGEPIFLRRILNLCIKLTIEDLMKAELHKANSDLSEVLDKGGVYAFQINGKPLPGEYVLSLWINGVYFHNDKSKAEKIREFNLAGIGTYPRAQFLAVLPRLTYIIIFVADQIKRGIKNNLFDFSIE